MFVLRRITSEGLVSNLVIGNDYSIIRHEESPDMFYHTASKMGWEVDLDVFNAFIVANNGTKVFPLYKKSVYYVMTDLGNTFERVQLV